MHWHERRLKERTRTAAAALPPQQDAEPHRHSPLTRVQTSGHPRKRYTTVHTCTARRVPNVGSQNLRKTRPNSFADTRFCTDADAAVHQVRPSSDGTDQARVRDRERFMGNQKNPVKFPFPVIFPIFQYKPGRPHSRHLRFQVHFRVRFQPVSHGLLCLWSSLPPTLCSTPPARALCPSRWASTKRPPLCASSNPL